MISLPDIARALGGEVAGRNQVLAPGPGHTPRDRSLSILITDDGFICHSFSGDEWQACRDHVEHALGGASHSWKPIKRTSKFLANSTRSETATDHVRRTESALYIWRHTLSARGSIVEQYLRSRGLQLPPNVEHVLRYHPRLRLGDRLVSGMVALMTDITTGEPRAIHRTFIEADGTKIGRKMLGPAKATAMRLMPIDDDHLVVGEGIETSLAAIAAGIGPAWALGWDGGIAAFPVIESVRHLAILGEVDDHGANARATQACAQRWMEAGRKVWLIEPTLGEDFAAVWTKLGVDWRVGIAIKRMCL